MAPAEYVVAALAAEVRISRTTKETKIFLYIKLPDSKYDFSYYIMASASLNADVSNLFFEKLSIITPLLFNTAF